MAAEAPQNRGQIVDANLVRFLTELERHDPAAARRELAPLDAATALALARAQFVSRHLDLAARALRREGKGYYTIGSSGHEGNAGVAHALRPSDPAFLHYRSGAFVLERARQAGYAHAVRDVMLGMFAARGEPIAGGRHKVWGSLALAIPPQTSTIASHLPKALGTAVALETRRALGRTGTAPDDAIVVCSFGDASLNHSTAQGALNLAGYLAHRGSPAPILFVCEDNGIGISVPSAPGWVGASMRARPGIHYVHGDGLDLRATVHAARAAVAHVRAERRPAFLHLEIVRLLGHAGSDVELSYHSEARIRADEARDPLLATARLLHDAGVASAAELLAEYEAARRMVHTIAGELAGSAGLTDASDVMWPIAPRDPVAISVEAGRVAEPQVRRAVFEDRLPEDEGPLSLSSHINRALADLCARIPELIVFGEDVARKGGIYGVTRRLERRFGEARIFDTPLDEQWILGLAMGAGHVGLLPVPEIQYLAFLHNAEDQLRGEAATLQFFSQAQFQNPMVLRLPSYGYQKGFGGHFHNDNSLATLRDLPGVIIASPSRGDDAAAQLRTCIAAARTAGSVCVFLEPIALYHTADLHEPGDGLWLTPYRADEHVPLGAARLHGDADSPLLLVTFANGVPMSLRVARRLAADGVRASVLDLRWLAPLPTADLLRAAAGAAAVLVVDETRAAGGVSEGVIAALLDGGYRGRLARVTSKDSFIPLGPAAELVLLSEAEIEQAARSLL